MRSSILAAAASRRVAPRLVTARLVACGLVACALVACGAGSGRGASSALDARTVDDETYEEVRRLYLVLAPDDSRREAVRQRLLEHLGSRSEALIAQGSYDAIVGHFAEMTSLLAPSDLTGSAPAPTAIAPVASWIVDRGSRRGDEPRVLSALLILARIAPSESAHREEYDRVATWGREVRWGREPTIGGDFFDLAPELIQVWEEHARLCPAPEVLDALAALYVGMRDLVVGSSLEQGFAPPDRVTMPELRMAQLLAERIPLDVAAVYLRVGDLARAAEQVGGLGDRGGIEWRLRRLIEEASGSGGDAADALGELAGGFERARPDVSISLCRLGHRSHPSDPRFPLCLARLSAQLERPDEATAWYAEAVELAPDDREVYDEALGRLAQLIESGLFRAEGSIGRVRMVGRHAQHILEQRALRWPNDAPAVSTAELYYHLGRAEMHAGNVHEASRHLEASLAARRTREALIELAMLRTRTGAAREAVPLYREALDRISQQGEHAGADRAALLEQLADALRASGDTAAARAAYAQALELITPLADEGDESRRALTRVRMGVLQRRIGSIESGGNELRAAIDAAPSWREPYAEILAHLVISEPDPVLAEEVFRRATTGLALEHEWRVYFALWVQAIAGRASQAPSEIVNRTLTEQSAEPGWHGRLAAFAAGTLPYDQLLAAAENEGQRCEAHFYAGARRLAQGDTAGAREQFTAALGTGMVGYFEYTMAQELLGTLR
jgi:tetratricopeptide (TPR) repeat protein